MMKRSAMGSVYDTSAPATELKVPTSNLPGSGETKVVWHSDLTGLVGPREEEARRKSPEMKVLYIVSAFLTIMVLWGIFREIHILVPNMFYRPEEGAQQDLTTLERIQTNTRSFRVDDIGVGGRKEAKHFLEVSAEEILKKQSRRFGFHVKDSDKKTALPRPGGFKTLPQGV